MTWTSVGNLANIGYFTWKCWCEFLFNAASFTCLISSSMFTIQMCTVSHLLYLIRVRVQTFVSPTLLGSSFVAQNSASVRGKIDQACWMFNTRCCPAGLPQPSGLISTANTFARRLTPNRAAHSGAKPLPFQLSSLSLSRRRLPTLPDNLRTVM